jgi:hypothetical protein
MNVEREAQLIKDGLKLPSQVSVLALSFKILPIQRTRAIPQFLSSLLGSDISLWLGKHFIPEKLAGETDPMPIEDLPNKELPHCRASKQRGVEVDMEMT